MKIEKNQKNGDYFVTHRQQHSNQEYIIRADNQKWINMMRTTTWLQCMLNGLRKLIIMRLE